MPCPARALSLLGALVLCTAALAPSGARAQTQADRVFFSMHAATPSDLQHRARGGARLVGYELSFGIPPTKLSRDTKLIHTFHLREDAARFFQDGADPLHGDGLERLRDFRYGLVLQHEATPRLSLIASPRLMVRSDFAGPLRMADLQGALIALGSYKVGGDRNFKLALGSVVTFGGGGTRVYPAFGVQLKREDYILDICYPTANLLARFERAELGFTASIDAATYHLGRGPNVQGVQAVWARTMNVAAGPALNLRTYKNLWFNVRGGAALVRDYDLLDSKGRSLAAADGDARVAPFFRVALSYRFE